MFWLIISSLLLSCSCETVQINNWKSQLGWNYISKFCFKTGGHVEVSITAPAPNESFHIFTYTDTENSWYSLDQENATSAILNAIEVRWYENMDSLNFKTEYFSMRDRWWFYAISNFESTVEIENMKFVMLNPGGFFRRHFSADKHGIFEMTIVFGVISVFATICAAYLFKFAKINATQTNLMYKITWICGLMSVGFILLLVHFFTYASDGLGHSILEPISIVMFIFCRVAFLFIGLMISRGWGISTIVDLSYSIQICSFCTSVFFLEICLYVYSLYVMDEFDVSDPMNSWVGWSLCLLQFVIFVYMMSQMLVYTRSMAQSAEAKAFYLKYGALFLIWVLSLPTCSIITSYVSDHYRTKVVFGLDFTALLLYCLGVLVLFGEKISFQREIDNALQEPCLGERHSEFDFEEIDMTEIRI